MNECLDLAELYLVGGELEDGTPIGPNDFEMADLAIERAGQLLRDRVEPEKQLVLRKLRQVQIELTTIERELKRLQRVKIMRRPAVETLEPLTLDRIEATVRELRVLGRGIVGFAVQVYGLNGQLVVSREVEGSQVALSELRAASGAPLANGVYLYVMQVQGVDGQVIPTGVNKLVILR